MTDDVLYIWYLIRQRETRLPQTCHRKAEVVRTGGRGAVTKGSLRASKKGEPVPGWQLEKKRS